MLNKKSATAVFNYRVNDAVRKQHTVVHGEKLEESQRYVVDLSTMTQEFRSELAHLFGKADCVLNSLPSLASSYEWNSNPCMGEQHFYYQPLVDPSPQQLLLFAQEYANWKLLIEFDRQQVINETNRNRLNAARNLLDRALPTQTIDRVKHIGKPHESILELMAQHNTKVDSHNEAARRLVEENRALDQAASEARAKAKREAMVQWANTNGSERLRKSLEGGFYSDPLYHREWMAHTFPSAVYDERSGADHDAIISPSLEGLHLLAELRETYGDIALFDLVYLTSPPHIYDLTGEEYEAKAEQFERCEAIKVDVAKAPHYAYIYTGK